MNGSYWKQHIWDIWCLNFVAILCLIICIFVLTRKEKYLSSLFIIFIIDYCWENNRRQLDQWQTKEAMFYFLQYTVYIFVFILVFLVSKNVIGENTSLNYWEYLISLLYYCRKPSTVYFFVCVGGKCVN